MKLGVWVESLLEMADMGTDGWSFTTCLKELPNYLEIVEAIYLYRLRRELQIM